jgi:hypothetical protein
MFLQEATMSEANTMTTTKNGAQQLAELEPAAAGTKVRAALIAAQAAAQAVAKEGRNDWHGYNYATAESVFAEAKMVLAAQGLGLQCVKREIGPPIGRDNDGVAATITKQWKVIHASGEEIVYPEWKWPVVPERGRPFDKAIAAAETVCRHYFTLDLLQISRTEGGVDMDDPARDRQNAEQARNGNDAGDRRGGSTKKPQSKKPPPERERERDDSDEIPEFMRKRGNDLIAELGITSGIKEYVEKLNGGAPVENKGQMRKVLAELELRVKAKKKSGDAAAAADAPQAAG